VIGTGNALARPIRRIGRGNTVTLFGFGFSFDRSSESLGLFIANDEDVRFALLRDLHTFEEEARK
jgi:hypothetical protein